MSDQKRHEDEVTPLVFNADGAHPVVLACEHASAYIPEQFQGLGLDEAARGSHIAWDPGAYETAQALARRLDARLVSSAVSRLVYDCNRPPEAADAMPARSEATDIPGNTGLTEAQKEARVQLYYRPFEALLSRVLGAGAQPPVLVTLHSFTPIYLGRPREVEIGILHDADARLADAMLEVATGYKIARNAPYGPEDGVTHTLRQHALPRGLLNVMIEIRSDLISSPQACAKLAEEIAGWLETSLSRLAVTSSAEAAP